MVSSAAAIAAFLVVAPLFLTIQLSRDAICTGDGEPRHFLDEALPTKSGYLLVNASSKARMFYAFYEAIEPLGPLSQTPLILWLQGGPGCSSMTGNFYEFGPWRTAPDLRLHKNQFPWNHRFGVLFLDNPVGTGFSIAETDDDIPTDEDQVANHLYVALLKFFLLQPGFKHRPFFIAGESYAGKYVPAFGNYVLRQMQTSDSSIRSSLEVDMSEAVKLHHPFRLSGLLIGNGLTDPEIQVQTLADASYYFGLIDQNQKAHVEELARVVVEYIKAENWSEAHKTRNELMDWVLNATGLATPLDVRRAVPYHCTSDGTEFLGLFLNQKLVKKALNAEDRAHWVSCNPRVRKMMGNDVAKSVKWMVEDLLNKLPVLLYQGHYDIKDGVVSSEAWMRTLNWEGIQSFLKSERSIWHVGETVAGYWRSYKTLTHVVVLGAGHMVPADQGLHSQKMIEKWITGVVSS